MEWVLGGMAVFIVAVAALTLRAAALEREHNWWQDLGHPADDPDEDDDTIESMDDYLARKREDWRRR